jgi:hypothetical protein
VQAVDLAEKERKHEPPIFVDIRLQRSVRAKGFMGDAFARVVGAARYRHMPKLGNRCVATGEFGIRIDDPSAVPELLQLAIECHRQNRRILFFCACELIIRRTARTWLSPEVTFSGTSSRMSYGSRSDE